MTVQESAQNVKNSQDIVGKRMITSLDQLVQILEISFIFLLTFSLIALIDTAFEELELYTPLLGEFLGRDDVGSLDGGNWEQIVRITLILNLLLFGFSLLFGIWMRRTRDGWTWADLGYTFSTGDFTFTQLLRRGFVLGLVAIFIHFTATIIIAAITTDVNPAEGLVYYILNGDRTGGRLYTARELNAEYYFGFVEMGFIWPLSAGFFFFAYCHKSLDAKFPTGIANLLSTAFYVFYLQFFFLISSPTKLTIYFDLLTNPFTINGTRFWILSFALFLILYINFSAFARTGSIVLPFLLNFVYNVGITIIQAGNALAFGDLNTLMFIPYVLIAVVVLIWYYFAKEELDTITGGLAQLKDITKIKSTTFIGYIVLFMTLSFFVPALIIEILAQDSSGINIGQWVVPILYALNFILLIIMAIIVLTYEPTSVWDVLLVSKDGTPIASHIEIFETDEVLISGFFTALQAVDQELSKDGGLKSIRRGEREILIEQGVMSQIIALADKDQKSIRQSISRMHRDFEIMNQKILIDMQGLQREFKEANQLVENIGALGITFDVPTQTRWISIISLSLAPIMIALIGLIFV